jgi:protein-tyrosine phosphatase
VVSLCRVGRDDVTWMGLAADDHVEVRLVDQDGTEANPHLALVMEDAADAVAQFRAEGKRVLLHCVAAQSRTPSVAALYSVRHLGVDPARALREVCAALPDARPNRDLAEFVLAAGSMSDPHETTEVPQ